MIYWDGNDYIVAEKGQGIYINSLYWDLYIPDDLSKYKKVPGHAQHLIKTVFNNEPSERL